MAEPPNWTPPPGGFVPRPGGAPASNEAPRPPSMTGPARTDYAPPSYGTPGYRPPPYTDYVNTQQAVAMGVLALLCCGNLFAIGGIVAAMMASRAQTRGDSARARTLITVSYALTGGGIFAIAVLFGIAHLLAAF